ncbi:MAG: CPBP family intramembrane metalloprotease [Propionibacteriaceae bacterium]|nr:CPBP family intramembrane metalloprotease [Propionibacteriaceae bacterium]
MTTLVPTATSATSATRRLVGLEIAIVLALTFGRSGVSALLSLIEKLTRPEPLSQQTTSMNTSATPDRPWLSLAYQVYNWIFPLAGVLLVLYLLHLAHGHARRLIGFDLARPARDPLYALGLLAAVGVPGLGFYFLARQLGINTSVSAANLGAVWWAVPALVVSALVAGLSEETVMLGYLVTRLKDLNWRPWAAIALSAGVRGSYHLYQGFGGFAGNVVMGVVFGWCYNRWGRVLPLVLAHALMDVFAFVGYALLQPHVPWL